MVLELIGLFFCFGLFTLIGYVIGFNKGRDE